MEIFKLYAYIIFVFIVRTFKKNLPKVCDYLYAAGFTSQISGLQLWFSKIKLSNLNNSLYLPFLSFLQVCSRYMAMQAIGEPFQLTCG